VYTTDKVIGVHFAEQKQKQLCDWSSGENWKHGWLLDAQLASYAGIRDQDMCQCQIFS
jgi:hypothetical protein